MKHWLLLLPVPCIAALIAMAPQNPAATDASVQDVVTIVRMAELQYVNHSGSLTVVPARSVVEVRLHEDVHDTLRLELAYENGDFSVINTSSVNILRQGVGATEVRLVRSRSGRMRFPRV